MCCSSFNELQVVNSAKNTHGLKDMISSNDANLSLSSGLSPQAFTMFEQKFLQLSSRIEMAEGWK